jgi:putrescine transport system substrate-binding protein
VQHKTASNFFASYAPLSVAVLLIAACGQKSADSKVAATSRILYIANYEGYIGKSTVANFEQRTGIQVKYGTYDSANTLEGWVWAGDLRYDVVSTSTDFFSREIKAGAFRPLDRAKLPNWDNLDPVALSAMARADPGNRHAVPYLHSINGFAYNVDMIKARMPNAPINSLDMLFKPEIVSKFADCGVTFLDSAADTLMLALQYLGLDPNTTKPEDYKAAENLLLKVRPYVRSFDSSEYLNGLANKELCIAMSWSSDYALSRARAKAVGVNVNLAFTVPKEGANQNFTSLLIPEGAPHPQAAYQFINFMLRPDVIAGVTNDIYYGNDNLASRPLVDASILNDPTLYPTPEIEARLFRSDEASAATERIRTRTWTRVKTAK